MSFLNKSTFVININLYAVFYAFSAMLSVIGRHFFQNNPVFLSIALDNCNESGRAYPYDFSRKICSYSRAKLLRGSAREFQGEVEKEIIFTVVNV